MWVIEFGMNIQKACKALIEHTPQNIFDFFITKTIKPWPNLRPGLYCKKTCNFLKKHLNYKITSQPIVLDDIRAIGISTIPFSIKQRKLREFNL